MSETNGAAAKIERNIKDIDELESRLRACQIAHAKGDLDIANWRGVVTSALETIVKDLDEMRDKRSTDDRWRRRQMIGVWSAVIIAVGTVITTLIERWG